MAATIETKRRLRAIRRLSASFPDRTAEERIKQIEGIASGKLEPKLFRNETSPTLMERLAAGQASRSPRAADQKKPEKKPEKKRKGLGGRDRQERGGLNRSTDLNT